MRYRSGFCSWCSVEKEDLRELKIGDEFIICQTCGVISLKIKEGQYYYLKKMEDNDGRA
jgi:Zn finger protein HypA/HybF involved in hydrogenase expression